MSDTVVGALIGVLGALAGSLGAFGLELLRRNKQRQEDARDALQAERASAYRTYIRKAHQSMHALAAVSEPTATPTQEAIAAAKALVHREARAALYELEIVADDDTVQAAWDLHEIIREFRDKLVAQGVKTDAPEWESTRLRYWAARNTFLGLARRDIVTSRIGAPKKAPPIAKPRTNPATNPKARAPDADS